MFNLTGEKSPSYGRKHTEEEKLRMCKPRSDAFRQKLREKALARGGGPNYNEGACEFFTLLNDLYDWDGVFATRGGEYQVLGYSLDYYEPNLNLVIEWDEEGHYTDDQLGPRDRRRQREIIKHLGCCFIRIRQRDAHNLEQLASETFLLVLDSIAKRG
jgi:hypothetical protein